jgi:hypothetical protein
MTKRQREIAAEVQEHREELLAAAEPLPCGYTITVPLGPRWVPSRGYRLHPTRVLLLREADHVRYQEDRPVHLRRKGHHEPRWRTLARL